MPNLTVYDWEGVDLVTDPYQRSKGSLDRAQNVEFSRVQGRGAIRKRAGLAALNSAALAVPIRGAVNVPLAGVNQKYIYSYSSGWLRTPVANPGVITTGQFPGAAVAQTAFGQFRALVQPQVRLGNKLFYPYSDAPSQRQGVSALDGVTHWDVARFVHFGATSSAGPLFLHRGRLCLTVFDNGPVVFYTYFIDPVTGAANRAAGTFPSTEFPNSGASYLGRTFLGTGRSGSTGRVMSMTDNAAAWTQERVAPVNHQGYICMATYKGELFAGTYAITGTAAIVEKRTAAGAWSTSLTGSDAVNANGFNGMIVYNDRLFAFYEGNPAGGVATVHMYDGSTWTTDLDLAANATGDVRGAGIIGADLYIVTRRTTGHGIWRRRSGTWSKIAAFDTPDGYIYGA